MGTWAKHPNIHHSVIYLHQPSGPQDHKGAARARFRDKGGGGDHLPNSIHRQWPLRSFGPARQGPNSGAALRDNDARSLGVSTKPSWRPRITPDSSSSVDYRRGGGAPPGGPPRQVSSTFLHDYMSVKVPPDSTVKLFKKCTCLPPPPQFLLQKIWDEPGNPYTVDL